MNSSFNSRRVRDMTQVRQPLRQLAVAVLELSSCHAYTILAISVETRATLGTPALMTPVVDRARQRLTHLCRAPQHEPQPPVQRCRRRAGQAAVIIFQRRKRMTPQVCGQQGTTRNVGQELRVEFQHQHNANSWRCSWGACLPGMSASRQTQPQF